MTKLRIKDLTKTYGNVMALEKFSLEINSGEFMVLLGPSGCGKTTVLRCIAGLVNPNGGEIYIGDELVNDKPPKDRDIAMVFQNYSLYPHMSVYNNIAFPLKMRKTSRQQIDERVRNVADLLDIHELLDRKPKEISGGQMQRVALGRALVREPKVFLMDEPLSNLDAKLRMDMRVEIKKLQKKVNITTLYITHDQVEAMSMADNIAIMKSGKLQHLGTPKKVYNEPANTFVASFIGTPPMNFIECKAVENNSVICLELNNSKEDSNVHIKFPNDLSARLSNQGDTKVIVGVRPKDISFLHDNQNFKGFRIKGEISFTELLGDDVIIEIKIGSNSIKMSNINSDLSDLTIGKEVTLAIDYNKVHFFTKAGNRINHLD